VTFEEWLEDLLDRANHSAKESTRIAMNSYGAGYDRGYADALQVVFAGISAEVAKCAVPDRI
jgi:hypothetical protein